MWVTENGVPDDGEPVLRDGVVDDAARVAYLRAHLDALAAARADGADVRRYFHWSLLDNFEWEHGYAVRFGLVRVEPGTLRRVPKRSALAYRDAIVAARNSSGPSRKYVRRQAAADHRRGWADPGRRADRDSYGSAPAGGTTSHANNARTYVSNS